MSRLEWNGFLTLLEKEIRRFLKVSVQTVLTPLVNSSLYLLIFGISIGAFIKIEGGITYLEFLIPGLVMMGCLNNAFQNASSSVITSKFSGDLEDLKVAPVSLNQIISAMALGGLIRGTMVGSVTFLAGFIFVYITQGTFLSFAHPFWLAAFIFIGGVSFSLLGMATAFWAKSFDHMAAVNSFLLLPLIYLGGVFYSIQSLHPFWQSVAKSNPLLYYINGVRFGILGQSDVDPVFALTIAIVSLVGLYFVAYFTLKRASFLRW